MDALRRNQYLQTMGVDVWVSRHPPAISSVAAAPAADARAAPPSIAFGADAGAADVRAGVGSDDARADADAAGARGRAGADADAAGARAVADADAAGARAVAGAAGARASVGADVASTRAAAEAIAGRLASEPLPPTAVPVSLDAPAVVTTWESLRSEVLACTKCPLHGSRTQGVFGVGSREAQWLVVGEAPGAEEDRRGEPFVGRAGHLLDAMLKAIGLSRGSNVYIANVLKSRPPGNRDPKPEEVSACLPYLMRQIELLRPRVMLAVGRIAAQNLLSTDVPLGRLRGKIHHFGELNTPLIVTYHPAYLLRTPSDKRKAWEDLKFARSVFQGLNPN
jgi:uracil-DNA glycosylase family 4